MRQEVAMQEIKCPKCGEVFQVDESGYAAIVKQVRDEEFKKELEQREKAFLSEKSMAVESNRIIVFFINSCISYYLILQFQEVVLQRLKCYLRELCPCRELRNLILQG